MDLTTLYWNTSNTTLNSSYYTNHLSCFTTLNFLTVIIAVVGLAGNAIVLWLLAFHLHRNAFSVYVLNLAGADFLQLCMQIVNSLQCFLHINVILDNFFFIVFMIAYLAGLCMIAAISAEHCLSDMWPIWYHCQRPRHTSAIMCALIWIFSLLLSLLVGLGCGILFSYEFYFCITCHYFTTSLIIVLSVVPSVSSLSLFVKMICASHRIPVTRFYVTIALKLMVFIFFGLPIGMYMFLLPMFKEFQNIDSYDVAKVIIFLSCVNNCANPVIYFLMGSVRHRSLQCQNLKQLLQRALKDTLEEEN
ncbi:mas-related G-protein coupled receptor member B5-like [Mus caroli]|uniref:Mas-related G-protein coupled receptor member B5-like n=1 Tax=Mus caroli TaxID=10089 RepID=A0A6P5P8F5_MUSCR|nr:mas-related G-protein coupled receptor member B5-like [Mus caroli]